MSSVCACLCLFVSVCVCVCVCPGCAAFNVFSQNFPFRMKRYPPPPFSLQPACLPAAKKAINSVDSVGTDKKLVIQSFCHDWLENARCSLSVDQLGKRRRVTIIEFER